MEVFFLNANIRLSDLYYTFFFSWNSRRNFNLIERADSIEWAKIRGSKFNLLRCHWLPQFWHKLNHVRTNRAMVSRAAKGRRCDPTCKLTSWFITVPYMVAEDTRLSGSETMDFFIHGTAGSISFMFTVASLITKSH